MRILSLVALAIVAVGFAVILNLQPQKPDQASAQNASARVAQQPAVATSAPVVAQAQAPTPVQAQPTAVPPTAVPPTAVPPTAVPPTVAPTRAPTTAPAPTAQASAPAAQPTAAPAAPTPAPQATAQGANQLYGLPPQPQIGHPSLYLETGIPCVQVAGQQQCTAVDAHTKHYVITLEPGTVGIIGGFRVDNVSDGVYKAVTGSTMETTVTDGFVLVTQEAWANDEFCFRTAEAIKFGWAHAHEQPLAGWKSCS